MEKPIALAVFLVVFGLLKVTEGSYMCSTINVGKRIHENSTPTSHDCRDPQGRNTCLGGQCVAYVKCNCTQNGKYPPATSCWRPGAKLTTANGQCNSAITIGTAVATFGSDGKYYGHAGAFMGCEGAYTIMLLDQWCSSALKVSRYPREKKYYSQYAVITSPNCADVAPPKPCRVETSGSTKCASYN